MSTTPPFDPPYETAEEAGGRLIIHSTAADGSVSSRTLEPGLAWSLRMPAQRGAVPKAYAAATTPARKAGAPARPEHAAKETSPAQLAAGRRGSLLLDVPFAEKDHAKSLGARWDSVRRSWYVPHGTDIHLFKRWWPETLRDAASGF